MERTEALIKIRPILNISENEESTEFEKFQNKVLRPLLKFQHDYLCFTFLKTPQVLKVNFINKHQDQVGTLLQPSARIQKKDYRYGK